MTVDEYVNNPSGGRVGGLEREQYKKIMADRLDVILLRENNFVEYECYKGTNNTYWLKIKVPSESTKGVTDDVVMKFNKPKDAINMGSTSLNHSYQVQFFSNDPAFNYTHAYVYNQNGLFPSELKKKASKVALKYRPSTTNLHETVTYCKSIYWAILIAKQRGLFAIDMYVKTVNMTNFVNSIEDTDIHIQKRQEAKKDQAAEQRAERAAKKLKKEEKMSTVGDSFNVDFSKTKQLNFNRSNGSANKQLKRPNFNKGKQVFK